ncbi:hypothetical protein Ahy_A07g035424 [Arachis hypogaea]|uniref:Uncharacterized protein n=1 Tax=Arachis hypogaea TaxID=3818 RepID=A0A445CDV4_ARAHY|nr:hypothetical protein Ahy_A07g035424 [Arachis hypogaea]
MERNVNGKGNREAATWDLRKMALFCLASRFCKLPESSAAGNQHWSCPKSLLLLPWELVLEPLMEVLCLVIFASCDIEAHLQAENEKSKESAIRAFQSIFGKEKAGGVRCDGRVTTPTLLKKN